MRKDRSKERQEYMARLDRKLAEDRIVRWSSRIVVAIISALSSFLIVPLLVLFGMLAFGEAGAGRVAWFAFLATLLVGIGVGASYLCFEIEPNSRRLVWVALATAGAVVLFWICVTRILSDLLH